jgi:hypothetical protein
MVKQITVQSADCPAAARPVVLAADLSEIRETLDHTHRISVKPELVIVKMLNQVIGDISDEWFGSITSQGCRSDRNTFPA